jgi:undecaprenyl-diphosphatase
VLTDQLANLVKLVVERVRPSREPELAGMVHHVKGYLSGGFSFVSGHASNVFGFALLSSFILKQRAYTWSIFVWASVVSYSRIYLGVHYPLDILGGMVLGMGVALIVYAILRGFQTKLKAGIKSQLIDS